MKYLFIDGDDYAAMVFEDNFKGDRLELWNKSNEAGETLSYENEAEDMYFDYEALDMDENTVIQMQNHMDYDDSKHANYFEVEEEK